MYSWSRWLLLTERIVQPSPERLIGLDQYRVGKRSGRAASPSPDSSRNCETLSAPHQPRTLAAASSHRKLDHRHARRSRPPSTTTTIAPPLAASHLGIETGDGRDREERQDASGSRMDTGGRDSCPRFRLCRSSPDAPQGQMRLTTPFRHGGRATDTQEPYDATGDPRLAATASPRRWRRWQTTKRGCRSRMALILYSVASARIEPPAGTTPSIVPRLACPLAASFGCPRG
ncbi:hypothetical protein CRG98_016529 [Punica granatum]|uniref:Uncharacterized protein n=1 Tax=Punica granatum TaxID=22663 RepID=A0A2I0K3F3_PUNGR|nr:hypothetical protein CRG98_016529 [Punica granatum]